LAAAALTAHAESEENVKPATAARNAEIQSDPAKAADPELIKSLIRQSVYAELAPDLDRLRDARLRVEANQTRAQTRELVGAITKAANRPIEVDVHIPPGLVTMSAQLPPTIEVKLPEQPPAQVIVNLPEQAASQVHIDNHVDVPAALPTPIEVKVAAPEVTVQIQPERKPRRTNVRKEADGSLTVERED